VGGTSIAFDDNTCLTAQDRGHLLAQLEQMARALKATPKETAAVPAPSAAAYARPRKLSPLELAGTRKRLLDAVPPSAATEVLRQVVWAAEEGALRRFELSMAVNIAIRKIREGA
jgi:hypothetical protein